MVATEGGGIYAAYNTAMVLAVLQDRQPAFAQHVFCISGVSGGSVGASVFTALAAQGLPLSTPTDAKSLDATPHSMEDDVVTFFGPDFLSPLIAKAVFPDLFQQFFPIKIPPADRARALEQSFELAWDRLAKERLTKRAASTVGNPFSNDFDALWPHFYTGAAPALLLNTTEVETGMQLAVSNLSKGQYGPQMFFDDHKFVHVPLSTAAVLSARFPLVTPAGLEPSLEGTGRRYVDGGYFENSGFSTLSDVIANLLSNVVTNRKSRPVRLVGGATDAELAARLGIRPTKYEGPTGIVGVLNTICREQGFTTASLWANVPHYISGIENPKATLALVRRVLPLLGATLDLVDLEDAGRQFDQNLTEIVRQNAKIANYVKKLESRDTEEPSAEPSRGSDLPPASELVAEIEQFLRQQRPE